MNKTLDQKLDTNQPMGKGNMLKIDTIDPTGVVVRTHTVNYGGGYGNRLILNFEENTMITTIKGRLMSSANNTDHFNSKNK